MPSKNFFWNGGHQVTNTLTRQMFYINDIEKITGRNRLTLRRWWEKGSFPKPRKLHSSVLVWHATDLQEWINKNIQGLQDEKQDSVE